MPRTTKIPLDTVLRSKRMAQTSGESVEPRILVAGIGNRLMGDDGFGPRVIDLLSSAVVPASVDLRDFGTAGLTIATELEEYDLVIFLDSADVEGEPGVIFKTEVVVEGGLDDMPGISRFTLHEVGLEGLLEFSKAMGTLPSKVILIGCKPKSVSPGLELSKELEEATHRAADMVLDTLQHYLSERGKRQKRRFL
jgi:hydrogenase maturation protease